MTSLTKKPHDLSQWLHYLEHLHPITIDMGLSRITQVFNRLDLSFPNTQIITVAGTNGKGTTCATIEAILMAHEYSVAVYSSPHIERFTERLRINQVESEDEWFCKAFEAIEQARGDVSLSYFEYSTLAALIIAAKQSPDFLLLEVGLGGRLDAVNVIDSDVAVITTIDLDHQGFLGDTREAIGAEKAGILRAGSLAVFGDHDLPQSVHNIAQSLAVDGLYQGREFTYQKTDSSEMLWSFGTTHYTLPIPQVPLQNASTALATLSHLKVPLDGEKLLRSFKTLSVPGRCQWLNPEFPILVDVAHNPQAARYLASQLEGLAYGKLHVVVGVLEDKDIKGVIEPLLPFADAWYPVSLDVPRGADASVLKRHINAQSVVGCYRSVMDGCETALDRANKCENDLVLVYGSFYTIADVLTHFKPATPRGQ